MQAQAIMGIEEQQTNLTRANREMQIAVGLFSSASRKLRALLIGPGSTYKYPKDQWDGMFGCSDAEDLGSSYQPFMLASYLEERLLDYELTIVDLCPGTLDLIRSQEEVKIRAHDLQFASIRAASHGYVRRCGLSAGEYGLRYDSDIGYHILYASIPHSFGLKRSQGGICFVEGDIAAIDLAQEAMFDLAVCTNVLRYQPDDQAKIAALSNIMKSLASGGYLIINDLTSLIGKDGKQAPHFGFEDLTARLEDPKKPLNMYLLQKI
jgi:hypothetical protein